MTKKKNFGQYQG